jgi:hypothetical protein
MRNFGLGLVLGVILAVCGYKPYAIETEYRRNIERGISLPKNCLVLDRDRVRIIRTEMP